MVTLVLDHEHMLRLRRVQGVAALALVDRQLRHPREAGLRLSASHGLRE